MNNQEILTKAIQKAIDSGWDIMDKYEANKFDVQQDVFQGNYVVGFLQNDDAREVLTNTLHWSEIIFNHDFAKALWGTELIWNYELPSETTAVLTNGQIFQRAECWQYHLMQMVIAADPLEYLGEHLDG